MTLKFNIKFTSEGIVISTYAQEIIYHDKDLNGIHTELHNIIGLYRIFGYFRSKIFSNFNFSLIDIFVFLDDTCENYTKVICARAL